MKRALDLFCGAGGASMGLYWAGYEVVGVDISPQTNYPFEFVQADALTYPLDGFDFIWASPPCQRYTSMLNHGMTDRTKHPDYIDIVRRRLSESGIPFTIENVVGAPLISPVMLCGEMFKLRVMRHRLFESSFPVVALDHPQHHPAGGIRKQGDGGYYYRIYGHETGKAEWGRAMNINWMRSCELSQAIPPAYSEYIAQHVL